MRKSVGGITINFSHYLISRKIFFSSSRNSKYEFYWEFNEYFCGESSIGGLLESVSGGLDYCYITTNGLKLVP